MKNFLLDTVNKLICGRQNAAHTNCIVKIFGRLIFFLMVAGIPLTYVSRADPNSREDYLRVFYLSILADIR